MLTKRARQKAASGVKKHGKVSEKPAKTVADGATSRVTAVDPVNKTITITTDGPPRIGRPTKLTPDLKERIVGAIRSGAYNETAAAFAGIAESTFYAWLANAQKDREANPEQGTDFTEFQEAVEKAQAEAELDKLLIIGKAARGQPTAEGVPGTPGSWQAAAWMLERKHPDRYGRRIVQIPDPTPDDPKKKGKAAKNPQYFRFGGQILEI
jgi:transposase-like protein